MIIIYFAMAYLHDAAYVDIFEHICGLFEHNSYAIKDQGACAKSDSSQGRENPWNFEKKKKKKISTIVVGGQCNWGNYWAKWRFEKSFFK